MNRSCLTLFFCNESLGGVGSTRDFIFGGEILVCFEFFGCQILTYKKEKRHILSSQLAVGRKKYRRMLIYFLFFFNFLLAKCN